MGGEKNVSFCWFMFGLWSVSCSTTHLLYLGCPVRPTAETHWKHQVYALTKGPVSFSSAVSQILTESGFVFCFFAASRDFRAALTCFRGKTNILFIVNEIALIEK